MKQDKSMSYKVRTLNFTGAGFDRESVSERGVGGHKKSKKRETGDIDGQVDFQRGAEVELGRMKSVVMSFAYTTQLLLGIKFEKNLNFKAKIFK